MPIGFSKKIAIKSKMTVKEVTVALTEADVKKIEPRRRRTRKVGGQTVDVQDIPVPPTPAVSQPVSVPTPAQPVPVPVPVPTVAQPVPVPVPTVAQPVPVQPTTAQAGGVHIKTRKRTHGSLLPPTPIPSKSVARILPIKRHAMPSKDKPKLRVGGQVAQTVPTQPSILSTPTNANTVPAAKRRFTERRIGISVRSLKNTRKARKSVRKQVAAMSTEEIRKILTEKGILKGKGKTPEDMLRSLMKDYLSLKQ